MNWIGPTRMIWLLKIIFFGDPLPSPQIVQSILINDLLCMFVNESQIMANIFQLYYRFNFSLEKKILILGIFFTLLQNLLDELSSPVHLTVGVQISSSNVYSTDKIIVQRWVDEFIISCVILNPARCDAFRSSCVVAQSITHHNDNFIRDRLWKLYRFKNDRWHVRVSSVVD